MMATKKENVNVQIMEMIISHATIKLIGDSPLIVHAWDAKVRQALLDKSMMKPKAKPGPKDPEAVFYDAFYRLPGRSDVYGFPAVAFKSAAVDACSMVSDFTKVNARGAFHIIGDMIELSYSTVMKREDITRIGMMKPDVRIRPEFRDWSVELNIRYNSGVISLAQLANLFNVAGFSIGVGEWRPQKDGSFGMFHVESAVEIK